jgi:putative endonuclease
MKGKLVQGIIRSLDAAAGLLHASPATPAHLLTGKKGEEEAYFYLRRHGYTMVARNWRSPRHRGELDLVGWDGDVLCFIEVKTRTTREVKPAEAAVDQHKRRELAAVARDFRRRLPAAPALRFDIVSVYCEPDAASPDITLFKNAFSMP